MTDDAYTCADHPAHDHTLVDEVVLNRAVELFAALGDPSRLRLMEILQTGRHCVSELAAETDSSLSSVSQRLKQLARARLVSRAREGKHVYYSLTDDHVRTLLSEVFAHVHE